MFATESLATEILPPYWISKKRYVGFLKCLELTSVSPQSFMRKPEQCGTLCCRGSKRGGHPRTFLVPLRLFSIKKSTAETFAVPFRVWGEKIGLEMSCFRIVPLTGAKHLQPCPQNRILVILRGSYQDFRQLPHTFYMGVLLWVLVTPANLKSGWDQKGRCGFQRDDNIKKIFTPMFESNRLTCLMFEVSYRKWHALHNIWQCIANYYSERKTLT